MDDCGDEISGVHLKSEERHSKDFYFTSTVLSVQYLSTFPQYVQIQPHVLQLCQRSDHEAWSY